MFELSANLELLFSEAGGRVGRAAEHAPARVRAAAAAGFRAVDIWWWSDKDLDRFADSLTETGVQLQSMCVEPIGGLTDTARHARFLEGLESSLAVARRLDCPFLVVQAGDLDPARSPQGQRLALTRALAAAAEFLRGEPVTLLVENLNSRVDHPGTFLDSTPLAIDIVRDVDSPCVKLLYDLYHSRVMDEDPKIVLHETEDVLAYVQIADAPGRHEPGTGDIDWPAELATLHELGYRGRLGLEYLPLRATETSLQYLREVSR